MNKKRIAKDTFLQSLTWLSALLGLSCLILIIAFVCTRGWQSLSLDLLTKDYHSQNYLAEFDLDYQCQTSHFVRPRELSDQEAFSERYGVIFKEGISAQNKQYIEVTYIDANSPLKQAKIATSGRRKDETTGLGLDLYIQNLVYQDKHGEVKSTGLNVGHSVYKMVENLDSDSSKIISYQAQTKAGGIRGAILQTLLLIALSLLLALPIGVSAAVYLEEIAAEGNLKTWLISSIEILAGVPSIIFGLMGISLLYPITKIFGYSGQTTLLGAMTMAVILLPLIIRQSQEALKNVPLAYRMASLSLGATRTQTIFKLVLPNALPGIVAASLLSIGRVIGESAAMIFTLGVVVNDQPSVGSSGSSLALVIWSAMGGEEPNLELATGVSIIILALVLGLNLIVKLISRKFKLEHN